MSVSLSNLMSKYPSLSLADYTHNNEILNFIAKIPMLTEMGGLSFDRNPDFFALTRAQGEKAFTFLFRNSDQSLAGIGCISLIPMQVNGESSYLGYTSDLRLSPQIEQAVRMDFYRFYEELIHNFQNLSEFNYCQHIFATIFDGNRAARKALVEKKNNSQSQLVHRPFFAYDNINVMGRISGLSKLGKNYKVVKAKSTDEEQIVSFLTHSHNQQGLIWSEAEIRRRLDICALSFEDFLLIRDRSGQIAATCLLMSDQDFRRVKITRMPLAVKVSQLILPLLGQPPVKLKRPLNIGHLCFFKVRSDSDFSRTKVLSSFLTTLFVQLQNVPRSDRFHTITLQEPQRTGLISTLRRKGFLCVALPSTLYQVYHEENARDDVLLSPCLDRPDFDFVFH